MSKMTDEEEYDDEEEDDEELTEEERKKRRRLRELKEKAKKLLEKSSHGKIPEGFMDAFGGQENAHKYYKHHDFKFTAEPKTPIPEVRPSAVSGDNWKEPQRWYPHISQSLENKQRDNEEPSNKLFRFMEVLSEDERREIWNIFYRQANGLEEPTHEELERIEAEAKLDFADLKNETIASEAPIDPSFGRTIFDPEPSDADILRNQTLRKLGHGHGKCVPADSLEEEHDV